LPPNRPAQGKTGATHTIFDFAQRDKTGVRGFFFFGAVTVGAKKTGCLWSSRFPFFISVKVITSSII